MKSKPILFSQPMVKAILDGRKTQTRRIVKPQPIISSPTDQKAELLTLLMHDRCPYGKPGDTLWDRETFFAYGYWSIDCNGKKSFIDCTISEQKKYHYIDNPPENNEQHSLMKWHKRPSLFMPTNASRLNLFIKSIRVERLQDISNTDAIREGIELKHDFPTIDFMNLWISINDEKSWNENPWVWVVEFEKIEKS